MLCGYTAACALFDNAFRSKMHFAILSFCCKRKENSFQKKDVRKDI